MLKEIEKEFFVSEIIVSEGTVITCFYYEGNTLSKNVFPSP